MSIRGKPASELPTRIVSGASLLAWWDENGYAFQESVQDIVQAGLNAGASPSVAFTGLIDTPGSYSGVATYLVRVNASGTALEFVAPAAGGVSNFVDLGDTPAVYAGDALKVVRVNAGETGLEFVTAPWATAFLGLTDSPSSYSGQGLKYLRVNAAENAVEFADSAVPEGGPGEFTLLQADETIGVLATNRNIMKFVAYKQSPTASMGIAPNGAGDGFTLPVGRWLVEVAKTMDSTGAVQEYLFWDKGTGFSVLGPTTGRTAGLHVLSGAATVNDMEPFNGSYDFTGADEDVTVRFVVNVTSSAEVQLGLTFDTVTSIGSAGTPTGLLKITKLPS